MKRYRDSRTQEKVSEYHIISKLYEKNWVDGNLEMSIVKSDVDKGVDFIVLNKVGAKFIQLKSVSAKKWQTRFSISENLTSKSNWAIIVVKLSIEKSGIEYQYRFIEKGGVDLSEYDDVEGKMMKYKKIVITKKHDSTIGEILGYLTK